MRAIVIDRMTNACTPRAGASAHGALAVRC
jgi:hypothetical protein